MKIRGENITPNHLHKKISCKAKHYCMLGFFLCFFFAWLSAVYKFPLVGPWETAHPETVSARQSKAMPMLFMNSFLYAMLSDPRRPKCLSPGMPVAPGLAKGSQAPSCSPASLWSFDAASPLLMVCALVLMRFRVLTTERMGHLLFF